MADFKAKAQRLVEEYDEEDAELGRTEGVVRVGKVKEVKYSGGNEVNAQVEEEEEEEGREEEDQREEEEQREKEQRHGTILILLHQ